MAGTFDPTVFLNVTLTDPNDTVLIPVPEGDFPGMCGEPNIREALSKDGSQKYTFLEVPIEVDSSARTADGQSVKDVTGRDKNSVRYSASLDFIGDGPTKSLDTSKGKNVGLGRLREATGLNQAGQPFNIRMFQGRPLKVKIKHSMAEVRGENQIVANAVAVMHL